MQEFSDICLATMLRELTKILVAAVCHTHHLHPLFGRITLPWLKSSVPWVEQSKATFLLACLPASRCAERTQNAFALHTLVGARLRQSEWLKHDLGQDLFNFLIPPYSSSFFYGSSPLRIFFAPLNFLFWKASSFITCRWSEVSSMKQNKQSI